MYFSFANRCQQRQFGANMATKSASYCICQANWIFLEIVHIGLETFIFNTIILTNNFIYLKNWTYIFSKITEEYEIYFHDKLPPQKNLKYFHCWYIFPIASIILLTIADTNSTEPFIDKFYYITTLYAMFLMTVTKILFLNFLLLFKTRYNCLNVNLENLLEEQTTEMDTINEIKSLRRIFRKMNKSVLKLNEIFGCFTFSFTIYFVVRTVYWIFLAKHPERFSNHFYIIVVGFIVHNWVL